MDTNHHVIVIFVFFKVLKRMALFGICSRAICCIGACFMTICCMTTRIRSAIGLCLSLHLGT